MYHSYFSRHFVCLQSRVWRQFLSSALCIISGGRSENTAFRQDGELKTFLKYLTSIVNKKAEVLVKMFYYFVF